MVDEVLSQEEIDALLHGVDDGEVETEDQEIPDDTEFSSYDLASQDRIIRGRMPALDLINERFARLSRVSLFNFLRRSSEVSVGGIQIFKFSEYVQQLYTPISLNIVKMKPLRGVALISVEAKMVFRLVEAFFGGEGKTAKIEGRDFTPTELRVVQMFLDLVFADLVEAWKPVYDIQFELVGTEINPQMANIVDPNEGIVVSVFHIEIEGNDCEFHVAVPYSMLQPIKDSLDSNFMDAVDKDERWAVALQRDIMRAGVVLECTVVDKKMSLREVIDLEPGDVISVEIPESLVLRANGVPIFKTRLGTSRGKLALEVLERTSINQMDDI